MSALFAPSNRGSLSDLDGFSVAGDNFYPQIHSSMYAEQAGDFGFDPPKPAPYSMKMEQMYSPPDDSNLGDFNFDPVKGHSSAASSVHAFEVDHIALQSGPHSVTAVSRYGQVTPPRSNSESSVDKPSAHHEPKAMRQRRSTKGSIKDELVKATGPGRKRKNSRKDSTTTVESPEEDEKRKQSLEKNRLAAAKCRVNKKEKTEQLQRDSHDKAVHNAFLKDQIMRMKEEVQQMNALLLAHANCEGCKSPEDIQKHLNNLGNEFFAQHMPGMVHEFPGFANMHVDIPEMEHDHYFSPTDANLMHPPLPDFDREPEFDVVTPMHTD